MAGFLFILLYAAPFALTNADPRFRIPLDVVYAMSALAFALGDRRRSVTLAVAALTAMGPRAAVDRRLRVHAAARRRPRPAHRTANVVDRLRSAWRPGVRPRRVGRRRAASRCSATRST